MSKYDYSRKTHAVDAKDDSPIHLTYPTGYSLDCNWCWLGYSHTENAHTAEIAETQARRYTDIETQAATEGWAALVEAEQAAYEKRQAVIDNMSDDEYQDYISGIEDEYAARYDATDGHWS